MEQSKHWICLKKKIRWLHQKSADLDLQYFKKRIIWFKQDKGYFAATLSFFYLEIFVTIVIPLSPLQSYQKKHSEKNIFLFCSRFKKTNKKNLKFQVNPLLADDSSAGR